MGEGVRGVERGTGETVDKDVVPGVVIDVDPNRGTLGSRDEATDRVYSEAVVQRHYEGLKAIRGNANVTLVGRTFQSKPVGEATIQSVVKARLLEMASGNVYRNSPTAPTSNVFRAELAFDRNGRLLTADEAARSADKIAVQVIVDHGRIGFDDQTLNGLIDFVGSNAPREFRDVAGAVLRLRGQPIMDAVDRPEVRAALPAPAGTVDILDALPQGHVLAMQAVIIRALEQLFGGAAMTIFGAPANFRVLPDVFVGRVVLDANGHIVGTSLARPDYQSPRGTTYDAGYVGGEGTSVYVVIDPQTHAVLGYRSLGDLNDRQSQAMASFYQAQAADRERYLAQNPYLLSAVTGGPEGRWLRDFTSQLKVGDAGRPVTTHFYVVKTADGYQLSQTWGIGKPAVAAFDVTASVRPGQSKFTGTYDLQFQMVTGAIPMEMIPVLSWAIGKMGGA